MNQTIRDCLINAYLEYVNNYLTVAKFAEHNGLTEAQAVTIIAIGKELHSTPHPES